MFAIGEMRTWSTFNCHAIACKRFVLDAEQGTRFLKKSEREAGLNSRGSEPRCPSIGHLPSAESTRDHRRMLRTAILFTFLFGTCVAVGKWKAFREDEKDKIKKIKALLNVEESNLMSTNRIEAYPAVWNTTSR
jgi:hypothetical protein